MTDSQFVYPASARFDCTRCGDCCRVGQVLLGPGEVERLTSLSWQEDDPLHETAPSATLSGVAVLARRPDGSCVFLGEQSQCRIHERFGANQKPAMCRLFPFGLQRIGDKIAVDVSFACRSVSEHSGGPLDSHRREWKELLGPDKRDDADTDAAALYPFSRKYSIDGKLLWELQHQLLDLLGREGDLLFRLRVIAEYMRLAMTSDPRTEAARTLRTVMGSGIAAQLRDHPAEDKMDKAQRTLFYQLLFLHLNPTPPELLDASSMTKTKEVARRVKAAGAYKRKRAHPWIDNREVEVGFGAVGAVALGFLAEPEGTALVTRFLSAKILGQRFMQSGDDRLFFVESVPRWLLVYPMWIWTAKALAAEAGDTAVHRAHAEHAVRLLDRTYGQVRFSDLSDKQRKAWEFVMTETEFPIHASVEMERP